jgi:hypothetical protein
VLAEVLYLEKRYGPDWYARYVDESAGSLDEVRQAESSVPEAMLRYFYFNYNECVEFVSRIWAAGGWNAVNRLYETPPASTEQILHPEKYRRGEEPMRISQIDLSPALGPAWRPLDRRVFGEFDVYNYLLTAGLDEDMAWEAAEGWGGGRLNVYTAGLGANQKVIVHIELVWDSADNLDEFQLALAVAIDELGYPVTAAEQGLWSFSASAEYGYASWDHDGDRVDLLLGSDEEAVARARRVIESRPRPVAESTGRR